MSQVTKDQFLQDVRAEIDAIKQNATREELDRLNESYFIPDSPTRCIYGLMTGHCDTSRAKEIMDKSCIRQMDYSKPKSDAHVHIDELFAQGLVNGSYDQRRWLSKDTHNKSIHITNWYYLSALEGYVMTNEGKEKGPEIIAYLKGEKEELEL